MSFGEAVRFWLKLGCISFGGPTAQIAIMHRELVERRRWISERRFLHALNYCMLLPGPEAQQLATYIGWLMHGVRGALVAGSLFVLPSLFVLIALSWIYMAHGNTPAIAGVLYGVKPAVVAIVLFATWRIGSRTLTSAPLWIISTAAFIAISYFQVGFPYVILGAALAGYIAGRLAPAAFHTHPHQSAESHATLIDDRAEPANHLRSSRWQVLKYGAIGLLLWTGVEGMLWALFGWRGTFTQMGWFFSKAALLTFGGAYAVLPYVQQAAVHDYGWLAPGQMIDGLALGETTPGPLIMVVTFVGFVGGWRQTPLGPTDMALAGIVGALVATFFTFLPSFLFILIGAPLVEATRGDMKLAAPLASISAAVVGVILNLAVYFARHVLWPNGQPAALASIDWFAAGVIVAASVALWRFKVGVVPVIIASAVAGLLYRSLVS